MKIPSLLKGVDFKSMSMAERIEYMRKVSRDEYLITNDGMILNSTSTPSIFGGFLSVIFEGVGCVKSGTRNDHGRNAASNFLPISSYRTARSKVKNYFVLADVEQYLASTDSPFTPNFQVCKRAVRDDEHSDIVEALKKIESYKKIVSYLERICIELTSPANP